MKTMFAAKWPLVVVMLMITAHAHAADEPMPREDVVSTPAVGTGLCVSNLFQSNMVIQRDKPIVVWGWADPGEQISVSFAGEKASATANNDRTWEVTIAAQAMNASPQNLTIAGNSQTLTLENILIGDVWVLGGQSNMEFPISNVDDGKLEIVSANFPNIRLLTIPVGKGFDTKARSIERLHEWSSWFKRHYRKGDWEECTPDTVRDFSAIGYVFGRRLHMASQVPIGLIDASRGGTTVETWTPASVLSQSDGPETKAWLKEWDEKIAAFDPQADLAKRIENFNNNLEKQRKQGKPIDPNKKAPTDLNPGPAADPNRPGHCFASMIAPLSGLAVKGAVFHQGFNNCFRGTPGGKMYYEVFGKMITAWRANFQNPAMPFCIISLCTAGEPQTWENFLKPMQDGGTLIREAQYKTFKDFRAAGDKHIGFVSSFDLRKSWFHPQIKIPAGERAATWAIASQYEWLGNKGVENVWLPPEIKSVSKQDNTLVLEMSSWMRTADESDGRMLGFAIAGEDKIYYPANVDFRNDETDPKKKPRHKRDVLVLSSPFVSQPVHYRYAWARNPLGNIVSNDGVVLPAQRSDDFVLEDTNAKDLMILDLERRLKEAELNAAEVKDQLDKYTGKKK